MRRSLGVIGGGQLGRMLGLAAIPLGIDVEFLDHSTDVPAAAVGLVTVGWPGEDAEALGEWTSEVDVVTYELEGIPAAPVRALVEAGIEVRPGVAALEAAQDRWAERKAFQGAGIPSPRTMPVADEAALRLAVRAIGDVVVKTRTGGYDGKGQAVVRGVADEAGLAAAIALLDGPGPGLVVEELVLFDAEVSVIGARGPDGSIAVYPLARNVHEDGILRVSRVPADLPELLESAASEHLQRLLTGLGYVGVLAVEFFVVDGGLVANEMAPRVHNSGHWTIDAAETSQFEQHVRAVSGLPLGPAGARGPAAMVNLIGTTPDVELLLAVPGAHVHLYDKAPRPGRKLGHVTVTGPTADVVEERLAAVLALLEP